jgi:hypothetical protein
MVVLCMGRRAGTQQYLRTVSSVGHAFSRCNLQFFRGAGIKPTEIMIFPSAVNEADIN